MTRSELLQSFCDCSENRPEFNRPFVQGNYVIGTDDQVALLLPKDEADPVNYEEQTKPNMQRLISGEKKPLMEIDTKDIKVAFYELRDKINNIDRRRPECKGHRTVEYSYWDRLSNLHTTDLDCPICEGTGERNIHEFFRKKRYQYVINDKYSLSYPTMCHVIEVIDYFNLNKITLLQDVCQWQQWPFHIVDDRFHMVLAPTLYNHDDDDAKED